MNDPYAIGNVVFAAYYRDFDRFPKERRQAIANSSFCRENEGEETFLMAAFRDFGPDHPQAQGEFCWPLKR